MIEFWVPQSEHFVLCWRYLKGYWIFWKRKFYKLVDSWKSYKHSEHGNFVYWQNEKFLPDFKNYRNLITIFSKCANFKYYAHTKWCLNLTTTSIYIENFLNLTWNQHLDLQHWKKTDHCAARISSIYNKMIHIRKNEPKVQSGIAMSDR